MSEPTGMDDRTLTALRGSIAKWEGIVAGTGRDGGTEDCPLCQLFNNQETPFELECVGCPVSAASGVKGCRETPYSDTGDYMRNSPSYHAAAQRELDFLRSLLPEEEQES